MNDRARMLGAFLLVVVLVGGAAYQAGYVDSLAERMFAGGAEPSGLESPDQHAPGKAQAQGQPARDRDEDIPVQDPNNDERPGIIANIKKLTAAGDFSQLETRAEKMRTSESRTFDGWTELPSFYEGTNEALLAIEEIYGTKAAESQVQEWVDAFPDSVTPLAVRAHFQIKQAWKARGGTVANKVDPKQWPYFYDRLNAAAETLTEIHNRGMYDMDAHALWFTVGAAAGMEREDMEAIMLEGVKRNPHFEELYRGMAYYLLPQWQGKPGDIEEYANGIYEQFDAPHNEILYARIFGFVYNYHGSQVFKKTRFQYERVSQCLQALIREYPKGFGARRILCHLATVTGDQETALAMFDQLPLWSDEEVEEFWTTDGRMARAEKWARGRGDNPYLVTPLEKAVLTGALDQVTSLTSTSKHLAVIFSTGRTPLSAAIETKNDKMVRLLIERCADLTAKDENGNSVACEAVLQENIYVLKRLAESGADLNAPVTETGMTPLHVAAIYDCPAAAGFLVAQKGIALETENQRESGTPLMYAIANDSAACAKLLIQSGANINLTANGANLLHIAAGVGAVDCIDLLLKAGVDPTSRTRAGLTPLEVARAQHKQRAVEALEQAE